MCTVAHPLESSEEVDSVRHGGGQHCAYGHHQPPCRLCFEGERGGSAGVRTRGGDRVDDTVSNRQKASDSRTSCAASSWAVGAKCCC
jgi:hypothetical protein